MSQNFKSLIKQSKLCKCDSNYQVGTIAVITNICNYVVGDEDEWWTLGRTL